VTGSSVSPARSTGPALFVGTEALSQLWLFWEPLLGAVLAGLAYRVFAADPGSRDAHDGAGGGEPSGPPPPASVAPRAS